MGFSWVLFLFSGMLGIPLFLRRLHVWAAMFLALWFLYILGPHLLASQSTELGLYTAIDLSLLLSIIYFALSLWFGSKGNEMTAKKSFERRLDFCRADLSDNRIYRCELASFSPLDLKNCGSPVKVNQTRNS